MSQKRIHDYRGPRSSDDLNEKLVGIVLPGVYRGFHVEPDGSVSPGILLTLEGVRIEEDSPFSVDVPPGDELNPRIDLVVCVHEYQKSVPPPTAYFQVVQGTPAEEPLPPDIPEFGIVLATCRMEAEGSEWSQIVQAGRPMRVVNAELQPDHSWKIIQGGRGALLEKWDPNDCLLNVYFVSAGEYEDGDTIDWGEPVLTYGHEGIVQLEAVDSKLDQEIADRQAETQALGDAIDAHLADPEDAHDADAVSVADRLDQFTAENVETVLSELAGEGRTTETVKGNADEILAHTEASHAAHAAAAISILDGGDRYSSGSVEGALQEIAGEDRTTETVKANADAIGSLETDKLDKAGGTVEGQLNLEGSVIFNAAEVENVKFDDFVEFLRLVSPCQANSANWENSGSTWTSPDPGGSPVKLYIPISGIVGAELVSIDLAFRNLTGDAATVTFEIQGQELIGDFFNPIDLGSGGVNVPAGNSAVYTLVAENPGTGQPEPFQIPTNWWLQVQAETSAMWIVFCGAVCRYRRMRVVG